MVRFLHLDDHRSATMYNLAHSIGLDLDTSKAPSIRDSDYSLSSPSVAFLHSRDIFPPNSIQCVTRLITTITSLNHQRPNLKRRRMGVEKSDTTQRDSVGGSSNDPSFLNQPTRHHTVNVTSLTYLVTIHRPDAIWLHSNSLCHPVTIQPLGLAQA